MTKTETIRPERTVEWYAWGPELTRAIRQMWFTHRNLPPDSPEIKETTRDIMDKYDLTDAEWSYWAEHASKDVVPY